MKIGPAGRPVLFYLFFFNARFYLTFSMAVFHEAVFGYLNGELEHGSISQFYKNVDTVGPDSGFRARVDVLDIEESLAVVRVLEENWGGSIDFTDYLLMLKMDGQWKCVAKAYNQNSDTVRK